MKACFSEVYSEPGETSKMKLFVKIVDNFYAVTGFARSLILCVWLGSE